MARKPLVLITDDEISIRNILRDILEFENYEVKEAENGEDALDTVKKDPVDLVILDIKMKGMDGIETLEQIKKVNPDLPVIMISGHGTIQIAVEATKKGAYDFLEKPPDLNRLLVTVRNALNSSELIRENRRMRTELHGAKEIIGSSPAIDRVKKTIGKIAPSNSRVLITRENGTGKELVARSIHNLSKRAHKKFVDVNCSAIPAELLESELFGHEKGSFTGAVSKKQGCFEQADKGMLFLDEVGEMSPDIQVKLLRATELKNIRRVGGTEEIQTDVQII
jgi:DNA-binding NtrC family response regulator